METYSLPTTALFLTNVILIYSLLVSANRQNLKESLDPSLLPPNFLFGTASSSYQYEGAYLEDGKGLSNWDVFSHKPGTVSDGSNADVALDQYHRYHEDIELMETLGVNSYRFSISWARILPKGRFGDVNVAGISFYNRLIDALLHRGIEPFVTLSHFVIPQELEDRYGGWLSPNSQEDFAYFADICFRSFGDRVKYWVTFNEPNLQASMAYRLGIHPPARCSRPFGNCTAGDSEKEPFVAAHNMILSHAAAVDNYRSNYQRAQGGSIGIVLYSSWFEPISNSTADKLAAERAQSFWLKWILDPIIYGRYPPEMRKVLGSILPEFSGTDKQKLKQGLDFIGVNHYSSYFVQDCIFSSCEHGPGTSKTEGSYRQTSEKNGVPIGKPTTIWWLNDYPEGMQRIVTYVKEAYNNIPIFITENGYGEVTNHNLKIGEYLNDVKRVEYMAAYLDALLSTVRDGADVRGYFYWTLLDDFEWTDGYTERFGLHYIDYSTLKRTPKLSATWYKEYIAKHKVLKVQMPEPDRQHYEYYCRFVIYSSGQYHGQQKSGCPSAMATYSLHTALFLTNVILISSLCVSANRQNLKESLDPSLLPPNFLFGTASSSYQYEGAYLEDGKGLSNWDVFSHKPGTVIDGSNGDVALDQYHRYHEDIELMETLGVNSYRFSISWARILPKGRFGDVNVAGISFYNRLIDALLHKGIEPFVTLTHFDIPQELEDRYEGWLSPNSQEDFAYFADICFRSFGDRVKYWVTFNEPNLLASMAYRRGKLPPARCSRPFGNCTAGDSEKEPFVAAHNMILSHAAAVDNYRSNYQRAQGGSIGIVVHSSWFEPISNSTADKLAAERAQSFWLKWILDPIIYGQYPPEMTEVLGSILPGFSGTDMQKLKQGLDFIGINHYSSYFVQDCIFSSCEHEEGTSKTEGSYRQTSEKNGVPIGEPTTIWWLNDYPEGMQRIVTYVKEAYNNIPIFITENGYGEKNNHNLKIDEYLNDVKRVEYMADYLDALLSAVRDGADVRGYFYWTLLDDFEWIDGYTERFGLHYIDYSTLKRTPKLSATWYKDYITKYKLLKVQMPEPDRQHYEY
ncbi:uncharacterized protein LOC119987970 [Tripterygium wilfordii]|uniref:uncharacterized protein LOC119987970 n=1 Tax=Tripterygium wilfordii TaxID=458696 RepID=UPI0018F8431F|nr:uncharacterized protein LOC119987970 [Tripterygium wilfordii]